MLVIKTLFSIQQVIGVIGVTRRQLVYWHKTGLVIPSCRTKGGHARYSFSDLIALKTAKKLIEAGLSVQRIRNSIASLIKFLPTCREPLAELSLVATGDVILVLHQNSAFEALTGQEWILPIAELQEEARHWEVGNKIPTPIQIKLALTADEK